ncbi:YchJ family protein [Pseudoxanthomonas dokdonensis]|uniref:UPF0225 protein ABB29_12650 n=1 Tax=Pseudoxanthomonas dokdonensis TaxID=344882 RepID=A0A0R0CG34_9GAMM|nr:YchJ family metal-binding protein [Pseudoxanthomonas dokdonensis]KRG68469.1 hypothetical protein ABB29_12650 [Pseudoxanthomonas dokdonensis]
MAVAVAKACPCGSGRHYADCCGPCHTGSAAADAEQLMRSRYSAYVLADTDYLRATWDPGTCPADLDASTPATTWLGLSIRQHRVTGDDRADVEFIARYRIGGGRAVRIHELSHFVRRDGRWFYLDGEHY